MSKNFTFDIDLTDEIIDDFGETESKKAPQIEAPKEAVRPIHAEWSIVKAFNIIYMCAPKSRLGKDLFIKCAEAFSYLKKTMGLSAVQCVIIALLIEEGKAMSTRQMGKILGVTHLTMMTHHNDIEALFRKHWLNHRTLHDRGDKVEAYVLAKGVVDAVRENRVYEAEQLECTDSQEFVEKLAAHFVNGLNCNDVDFQDEVFWIEELVNANKQLPLCKVALEQGSLENMAMLMLIVADHFNYNGSDNEGLDSNAIELVYADCHHFVMSMMECGEHPLFREGLLEHKCEDGMANTSVFVASSYLKDEVLKDVVVPNHAEKGSPKMNGVKSHKDIVPKSLFYNESEHSQIERLRSILSQEQLPTIQQRLKEKGMRTGVCVLMHGHPGTGKTATAYEIARQTGRDIIQVQVTDFKDKYVGESEAKLKRIFCNYRKCCENSETMPILLLNEGDAILGKRLENVEHGAEQMMNALQNILLEEMENLEGIMIVTTNLTVNLDKAFERRFIFKILFEKPTTEVKAQIWQSMVDNLNEEDATQLARLYDVTGGEIENIARKSTMEYVLTGKEADLEMIKMFTQQEKLESSRRKTIGFTN